MLPAESNKGSQHGGFFRLQKFTEKLYPVYIEISDPAQSEEDFFLSLIGNQDKNISVTLNACRSRM